MISTDKPEFREHAKQLVVGMRHLPHEEVLEALWVGMKNLSLGQFVQLKEHCLSEAGPDKLPPVPGLWKIWRTLHDKQRAKSLPPPPAPPRQSKQHLQVTALFFRYLHRRRLLEKAGKDVNIDVEGRRAECLKLIAFLEASAAEDLSPNEDEVRAMFDVAMARIGDFEPETT